MIYKHFVIFFTVFLLFSCKKGSDTYICKVTHIEGTVYELNEDNSIKNILKPGDFLDVTSVLETDRESVIDLQFRDKSVVRIQENSKIKLRLLLDDQIETKTRMFVEVGEMYAKFEQYEDNNPFEIETETIVIDGKESEFVISVSEDKITKVAVHDGELFYSTKIDIEELHAIKKVNPEFAEKLEKIVKEKSRLEPNHKIEASLEDIKAFNTQVNEMIVAINRELIDKSEDKNEILQKYTQKLKTIVKTSSRIKKEKITEEEWQDIVNEVNRKKSFSPDEIVIKDTTLDATHDGDIEDDRSSTPLPKEKERQKYKRVVWKINKLPFKPTDELGETNTALTSNLKNLFITSDKQKAVYCINTINGALNWKYEDDQLLNISSKPVHYKDFFILSTPDKIFVVDSENGKRRFIKAVGSGTVFWAPSLIFGKKIIIPTQDSVYTYENNSFSKLKNFPSTSGQLFISNFSKYLAINESIMRKVKVYNLEEENVIWESDQLAAAAFMAPVIKENYLYIADQKDTIYRYVYRSSKTEAVKLHLNVGIVADMVIKGHYLYFIALDGYFYRCDLNSYNYVERLVKLDMRPELNKFLNKQLFLIGNEILYCSDTGKLFIYSIPSNTYNFIPLDNNEASLVATPVLISNVIFFIDKHANIYRRYKEIEEYYADE